MDTNVLAQQKCVPCEGGTPPFTDKEARAYLAELGDTRWQLSDDGKSIQKNFEFYEGEVSWNSKWQRAASFVQRIAEIAGAENHHPTFVNLKAMRKGGLVEVKFSTHVIGGLSKNDFIMAAKVNEIYDAL